MTSAPNRSISSTVTIAIVAAVALVIVLASFWWFPNRELDAFYSRLDPKDYLTFKNGIRSTAAQAIGGIAVLIGLFFAWRSLKVSQDSLGLAAQGQITERFTRAIDQLGSERLEIRIGAIYALERIARDSARDHWQIIEILTAYIRTHARWPPLADDALPARSADLQAILKVLRRRNRETESRPEHTLDLRVVDLRGADLAEAHFEGADLSGTHFTDANLTRAQFQGADLTGSIFGPDDRPGSGRAECSSAHFEGATFRQADLRQVVLHEAHLEGARLHEVDLTGAWFQRAHLEGAHLTGATGLTTQQIETAFGDEGTILDAGTQRPQTWPAARG